MDILSGLQGFKTLLDIFKEWQFPQKRESTCLHSPPDAQLNSEKEPREVLYVGNKVDGHSPVYIVRSEMDEEQAHYVCVECESILHIQPAEDTFYDDMIRFVCRNCGAVSPSFSEEDISY